MIHSCRNCGCNSLRKSMLRFGASVVFAGTEHSPTVKQPEFQGIFSSNRFACLLANFNNESSFRSLVKVVLVY